MLTQMEKIAYAGLLLAKAFQRWDTDKLSPCGSKTCFDDCLTEERPGEIWLWYNTPDQSTRVEKMNKIKERLNG